MLCWCWRSSYHVNRSVRMVLCKEITSTKLNWMKTEECSQAKFMVCASRCELDLEVGPLGSNLAYIIQEAVKTSSCKLSFGRFQLNHQRECFAASPVFDSLLSDISFSCDSSDLVMLPQSHASVPAPASCKKLQLSDSLT